MSIEAISGGGHSGSAWDYYQELKASQSGSGDASAQGPVAALASSTTSASAADATAGGGTGGFGQLLNDMQALFTDYSSASGAASGSIANAGTVLSSGGTLSTALLTDLSAITKDLTGIINGQTPPTSTAAASPSTSSNASAAAGPSADGTESRVAGHRHHGRHDVQAFSPWPDQTIAQGTTLTSTPNAAIDQLIAKTASPG